MLSSSRGPSKIRSSLLEMARGMKLWGKIDRAGEEGFPAVSSLKDLEFIRSSEKHQSVAYLPKGNDTRRSRRERPFKVIPAIS
jgi:hypothetical protein